MAVVTKSIRAAHGLACDLIPSEVLKSIDAAELMDRLVAVKGLVRSSQSADDATLRKGYATLARAMLTAAPRAVTERQVADRLARAAGLPPASGQAGALRREAQDLLERHPPAPRRGESAAAMIAKAAKAAKPDQVAVFDGVGNLVGIVDPGEIIPVTGASAPAAPAAPSALATPEQAAAAVTKAARAAAARRNGWR